MFGSSTTYLGKFWIEKFYDRDVYAENLTRGDLGCSTLLTLKPKLVFIGDSHTQSGWNFAEIARKTNQWVGTCAAGGANFVHLSKIASTFVKNVENKPEIILGLAPRQFWIGANSQKRSKEVAELVGRMQDTRLFWAQTMPEMLVYKPLKKGVENRKKFKVSPLIRDLDLPTKNKLEKILNFSDLRSINAWQQVLDEALPLQTIPQAIDAFCEMHKSGNAKITIVEIPESLVLYSLYKPSHLQPMISAKKALVDCGITYWNGSDYRLFPNRYFINEKYARNAIDLINTGQKVPEDFFDADHMNFAGANFHTELFLAKHWK